MLIKFNEEKEPRLKIVKFFFLQFNYVVSHEISKRMSHKYEVLFKKEDNLEETRGPKAPSYSSNFYKAFNVTTVWNARKEYEM